MVQASHSCLVFRLEQQKYTKIKLTIKMFPKFIKFKISSRNDFLGIYEILQVVINEDSGLPINLLQNIISNTD